LTTTIPYPFSALVGQEAMQLALLLNAVNPAAKGHSQINGGPRLSRLITPY
jgi:Mg-chelatase subunit ChlI